MGTPPPPTPWGSSRSAHTKIAKINSMTSDYLKKPNPVVEALIKMRESGFNDCEIPAFMLNMADGQLQQQREERHNPDETEQTKLARIQRNRALREAIKRRTDN